MTPVPCRVTGRRRETADTVTLELEPPPGVDFAFRPGQFNMMYAFGIGEVPISVSGDPTTGGPLVHTVRDVGMVTAAIAGMRKGEVVGLRGPFGSGWPVDEAVGHDVVIIAGGLGLAPLRPVLYDVLAARGRFRRVILLYGARTPDQLLFTRQLQAWRARFDLEVAVTVDAAEGGWQGDVGVVPGLLPRAIFDPADAVAMVCGPEIMMRFSVAALRDRGVPPEHIHLSMERNMRCAIGLCGHCQLGPAFVCREGPIFRQDQIGPWLGIRDL